VNAALANFGVPTSAAMSAAISAVSRQVLIDYDAPTSADISAIGVGVLTNYDVPTSADISAIASAVVSGVLASYDVASSADVSVLIRTARVNIGRVNDVSVSGAGTTADPWRPA
jgi:hypothetical protein